MTNDSFPEGSNKAKGDYNPPQTRLLAASRMLRTFGSGTGKPMSPMSFVLWMWELEWSRERKLFRAGICFDYQTASPDTNTPLSLDRRNDDPGASATRNGF